LARPADLLHRSRGDRIGYGKVQQDYAAHAHVARRLAEEHFDSDAVLSSLLKRAGLEVDAPRIVG